MLKIFMIILFYCTNSLSAMGKLCEQWGKGETLGNLNRDIVNEASGLIVSKLYSNRLYHVNDSGDGANIYQTTFSGKKTKKIRIKDFSPFDIEDLAYGPCGDEQCLIVGDIGDNLEIRKSVEFIFISEIKDFSKKKVSAKRILKVKYPDRAHNAEAMAMHPNGDIFIVTKERKRFPKKALPAEVFVLKKTSYENSREGETLIFKKVGILDLPKLLKDYKLFGKIVTSFDISSDGKRILILTYEAAIEFKIDLSLGAIPEISKLKRGVDFNILDLKIFPQQEAISYIPGSDAFIYTTEYKKKFGKASVVRYECV